MRQKSLGVLFFLLAGCAAGSSGWEAKDASPELAASDYRECRKIAERSIVNFSPSYHDVTFNDTINNTVSSPLQDYDRMKQGEDFRNQVAECMTDRGYRYVGK